VGRRRVLVLLVAVLAAAAGRAGAAAPPPGQIRIITNLGVTDRQHVVTRVFHLKRTDYAALEFYVSGMVPGSRAAWGKLANIYRTGHFWNYVIINNQFVRRINDQVSSERSTRVRFLLTPGTLRAGLNIITFTAERPYAGDFDDYDVADVRLVGRYQPDRARVAPPPSFLVKPRLVEPEITAPRPPPTVVRRLKKRLARLGPAVAFVGRWRYTVIRAKDKAVLWEGPLIIAPGRDRNLLLKFGTADPFPAQVVGEHLVRFVSPQGARVEWRLHPLAPVFVGTYRYPDGRHGLVRGERQD
jgi:hypothetical protein